MLKKSYIDKLRDVEMVLREASEERIKGYLQEEFPSDEFQPPVQKADDGSSDSSSP